MPSGGRPPPQGSHFSSSALHIVLGQVKKEGGDINGTSEQDLLSRVGRVDNGPHISCCAITAGGSCRSHRLNIYFSQIIFKPWKLIKCYQLSLQQNTAGLSHKARQAVILWTAVYTAIPTDSIMMVCCGGEHCPCEWGENGNYETYSIIGLANYKVCLASVLLLSELQDN